MALDVDAIRARVDAAAGDDAEGLTYDMRAAEWNVTCDKATAQMLLHAREDVPALLAEVKRLASLLAYTRESRDAYAATLDRVAAIVEPPHIATLENLSEVIDCARAAIE